MSEKVIFKLNQQRDNEKCLLKHINLNEEEFKKWKLYKIYKLHCS